VQAIGELGREAIAVQGDLDKSQECQPASSEKARALWFALISPINHRRQSVAQPILEHKAKTSGTRMFDINAKASLFLLSKKRQSIFHDNGKIISAGDVPSCGLYSMVIHHMRRQGPGGALHPRGRQGIFHPWPASVTAIGLRPE